MILHLLALLPNFDFYLRLHIKFHKLLFWVPISAAGGPYWVLIAKKLGPYLKAWGSLLVLETVLFNFCLRFSPENFTKKGKSSEFNPLNYEQVKSSPSLKVWSHKSVKDTVNLPKKFDFGAKKLFF